VTTPAGWYPDPGGSGQQRYFDGTNWTDNYAPYAAPAPPLTPRQQAAAFTGTGEPVNNRKIVVSVLAVLLALIVAGIVWTALTNEKTGLARPDAEMGQAVQDGKFEFVVSSVYESGEATLPQPRGTWMVAAMTIRNIGDQPQSFFIQNQKLIDTEGREYAADAMASFSINNDNTMVLNLGPGFAINVRVPFDVPPGVTPDKIEVHDSAYSGGALVKVEGSK